MFNIKKKKKEIILEPSWGSEIPVDAQEREPLTQDDSLSDALKHTCKLQRW